MKYHANDVYIQLLNFYGFKLVRGQYTVESFAVTPGQDPDNFIHNGLITKFGDDGKMTFTVGRKGSESTAFWFNAKVAASQTTFNHMAGKLNFAFMGQLELVMTGDVYGTNEVTFSFSNIAIAQGHSGASNNWWFGGTNCTNIGGNVVASDGTNSNGADITFNCMRGGNGVNIISLIPANMVYHANQVTLKFSAGYRLVKGSYTIDSHAITNGQDPNGNIYDGMLKTTDSNGKLSFNIGRKGSEDTAKWFNDRILASHTTFNHTAGKLNFAFIGSLKLTLTSGILGGGQEEFTFNAVAIAQGHSGSSNNWWFGGTQCTNKGNNMVLCQGINSKGMSVYFYFLRGGNGVSTIEVMPVGFVDTANWMSYLNDTVQLNQIMMPGSHDAGMSELHHCAPPIGIGGYTQTQSESIGLQLQNGSRYFDLRIDFDYNELVTYHRQKMAGVAWGCNGQSLKAILDQTKNFLSNHKKETVILKFSHIRDDDGHDPNTIKEKINDLLNSYTEYIYTNPSNINLANENIVNLRRKMILVFDYSEYIDPAKGRFRYKTGAAAISGANLSVYDAYSNTDDYTAMQNDQITKWNSYGGLGKGYFFLLSWTLTAQTITSPTIAHMAAEANGHLARVLYEQIVKQNKAKPNIVYLDYMNNLTSQTIIYHNYD